VHNRLARVAPHSTLSPVPADADVPEIFGADAVLQVTLRAKAVDDLPEQALTSFVSERQAASWLGTLLVAVGPEKAREMIEAREAKDAERNQDNG